MRPLYLYEIAHVIVTNKVGMVSLLRRNGLEVSDGLGDEPVFRIVIENKHNEQIRLEIFGLYDKNPLNQHCVSCFNTVRGLHDAGIVINNELKNKT